MVSDSAAPQTGEQVVRRLARSSLVNMAGAYFMTGTFAVYLSTVLNFSTGEVAFIYGLGPFIGVVASVPAGRMVDRYSPRFLLVWGNFAFGVVTCAIPLFDSALPVAAALALSGLAMAWNGPARSVYIVDSVPSGEVQLARARVRRFVFLGSTVGTLMATGSLALDNDVLLTVAVLANGLTSVFVAVFVLRGLPDLPKNHKDAVPVRRFGAVGDIGFILVTVLLGVTKLSGLALASALPIWMTNEARLPVAFAPVVVLMEAVIVVVFQVKLAPLSNGFMRSRFALVSGSLGVLAAFSMMATGGVLGGMAGALLFITGGIVYGFAAVLTVGAQWGISYALRPRKAQGEYQGMDSTVQGAVAVIGPAIVLFLTGAVDGGWFWLGGIVVLASIVVLLASGPLRARAIRLGKLDPDAA